MNSELRTIDLTLASMFVALMAVGANITSIIPLAWMWIIVPLPKDSILELI